MDDSYCNAFKDIVIQLPHAVNHFSCSLAQMQCSASSTLALQGGKKALDATGVDNASTGSV